MCSGPHRDPSSTVRELGDKTVRVVSSVGPGRLLSSRGLGPGRVVLSSVTGLPPPVSDRSFPLG